MRFVDEIVVEVHAGKGGDGAACFRRESHVPLGGPAGGNGGNGGDVVLIGDHGQNTLSQFRYRRILKAKNGVPGGPNKRYGKRGESLEVRVPVGVLVFDEEKDEFLGDIVEEGQRLCVAKGGSGGRGNMHFATPTNRAPHYAERGRVGESKRLRLELKLLADVGLLGFPSVGKSTFISSVSKARPKVADYPFTTLTPHLGVVEFNEYDSFVMADVPGLIVGASSGKGLGIEFLRHLERTRILLHIIEVTPQVQGAETERDPIEDFLRLNEELKSFGEGLAEKTQIVVLNKIDLDFVAEREAELRMYFESRGFTFFAISCATKKGCSDLVNYLGAILKTNDES